MDELLGSLRQHRDELLERTTKVADVTRKRGLGTLGKVRGGALDWRRTLAGRRAELDDQGGRWFRFTGLQLVLLDRADQLLAAFAVRVRAQMKRLRTFELPAAAPSAPVKAAPAPKRKKSSAAKKAKGSAASSSRRLVMPIADYDTLNAKDVVSELARLSDAQCRTVYEHERSHRKRKTVLKALEGRLAA